MRRELQRRERSLKHFVSSFRLQKDLLYVRQQLAPGLLQTCRQIHTESAGYLYSCNIWQFSHDEDWNLFFRFLITIGPQNRALIKNLEVYAPLIKNFSAYAPVDGLPHKLGDFLAYNGMHSKNHPKMQMTKTPHCDQGRGCCDCDMITTFELLMREKTLERIKFVVPRGSCVYPLDRGVYGGYQVCWHSFSPKVTLAFLPGAVLSRTYSKLSIKDFTDRGVCGPLSLHRPSSLSDLVASHMCGLGLERRKLTCLYIQWDVSAGPDQESEWGDSVTHRVLMNPTNEIKTWKGQEHVMPGSHSGIEIVKIAGHASTGCAKKRIGKFGITTAKADWWTGRPWE